ncbi:MAG: putative type secretion system protein precursor [Planctomycetota bacterium]|jgi:pilus assembly protein CpaC
MRNAFLYFGLLASCSGAFGQEPGAVDEINRAISHISEPVAELRLEQGHSKVVLLKQNVVRASIADPEIVETTPFTQREVELIGKAPGRTTVTLWLGDQQTSELFSFVVHVQPPQKDLSVRDQEVKKLEQQVGRLFPNSFIRLIPVADKIIVKGQARDAEEAAQIMSVLRRGGPNGGTRGNMAAGGSGNRSAVVDGALADSVEIDLDAISGTMSIINLIRIPGEHQVMLKVRIAELKRTAARNMSASFSGEFGDFLVGLSGAANPNSVVSGTFSSDSFELALEALESHRVAKVLAEPTLVTISGRPATFISGGEFAVPTVVGVDGVGAASTTFRGYGTLLQFTPTVLDKDRIRLQVNPQFSTLNTDTSVNGIFGVDTRSASTTVELREGQVLAIAGLTQQQQSGSSALLPGIGSWPILGNFGGKRSTSSSEEELLVIVSPEIVHAVDASEVPQLLPGLNVTEPTDVDFWLRNRVDGRPGHHHRSTVWPNYRDQLLHPNLYFNSYENSARYFSTGKVGFSQ